MRLINADELKKHIRRCDDSATRATFDYVDEDDIDECPTVYNIPDNATNGEVMKAVFKPNQITRLNDDWWISPYQKGGKTEC